MITNNHTNISFNNINEISKHADRRAEAFSVVKDKNQQNIIQTNGQLKELGLRIKHFFLGGGDSYRQQLKSVIEADVSVLNQERRIAYINDETNSYTELFLASQRYNQALNMHRDPSLTNEVPLFNDLALDTVIKPETCPQVAPLNIRVDEIRRSKLENIPQDQQPHILTEGWWTKHKIYHYNPADTKLHHGREAARIFISTQRERLISLIGRVAEAVLGIFKYQTTIFKDYHYFRNNEDKNDAIYAHDQPLSLRDKPTSYWIGHATCLFSVPLKTEQGKKVNINIISDPVEADLNKLLYPRMTKPARDIEDSPFPHIYMLSHNHLDHYDKQTIEKLRKHQPIMLVPEGDGKKFRDLGFKNIYEHNWWESTTIPIEQNGQKTQVKITAVPANHWSGQGPCDGHHAAFLGYVIHHEEGDIYFAGDTARLSQDHIETLRTRFNIRSMFQPGGPDEVRKDMESTHQASVDGLWMHFNLSIRNLYEREKFSTKTKAEFIAEAKKLRTIFMHTKAYKLGNLHYDDTDVSVNKVKEALLTGQLPKEMKSYEEQVYRELLVIGSHLKFKDNDQLNAQDILEILNESVIIPKIGSRTDLA